MKIIGGCDRVKERSADGEGSSSCFRSLALRACVQPPVNERGKRSECAHSAEEGAEAPREYGARPGRCSCEVAEPAPRPARRVPRCPLFLSRKGLGRIYLN